MSSKIIKIKVAENADLERCIAILTLAFSSDPVVRWIFPDPQTYLENMPNLSKAFGGKAFEQGSAFVSEGYEATALWLPPGVSPDEQAMGMIMMQSVPPANQPEIFSILEQMSKYHPKEPHFYLPLLGTDPLYQGQGFGSALLEKMVKKLDKEKIPAYLESSSPQNIPLYEKYGFKTIGEVQSGLSPTLWPMLRQPK